jgi:hypothetical protein
MLAARGDDFRIGCNAVEFSTPDLRGRYAAALVPWPASRIRQRASNRTDAEIQRIERGAAGELADVSARVGQLGAARELPN